MKVVVVGTGFGARVVAPAFAALDGVEVVDVVSARDEHAVAAAVDAHRPDLVSVHSPPFLHARHVALAIHAGAAVLCDKPLGTGADDSAAMLAVAERAGAAHFVNFEFRCAPARRLLRDVIADGAVGAVERVHWTHLSAGTRVPVRPYGWLFDASHGGGWVGAWASHAVDAVFWLLGLGPGDVLDVRGVRRLDVPERRDTDGNARACTAEDGLAAVLVFAGGVTVTFDSGFAASASPSPRLVVTGSDGILECVADRSVTLRRAGGERTELAVPAAGQAGADRHDEPMRRYAAVLRDRLSGREVAPNEEPPTFRDGHAVDEVLDRLRALPLVSPGR